ncbi:MAG TPA: twin-arginine translocation pathway signal protein [Casimicrobiaceae bacterium]|nr:twin-arginine translocation pathway signal protein [Casimicrobiaceae bacterium]
MPLLGVMRHVWAQSPGCVLTPAVTEGPFFVDERLNRSDLTADARTPGVAGGLPLRLVLTLHSVRSACAPLAGVQVDVWHCDAQGNYSDVGSLRGARFLRGYQVSDAAGRVAFRTIYPGWYPGRTVHIHIKARRFDPDGRRTYEFTTQLFFDEALNDSVLALPAYTSRGRRDTRNADEGVTPGRAAGLIATTHRDGSNTASASLDLGLDIAAAT